MNWVIFLVSLYGASDNIGTLPTYSVENLKGRGFLTSHWLVVRARLPAKLYGGKSLARFFLKAASCREKRRPFIPKGYIQLREAGKSV